MRPEVVQSSTDFYSFPASSVLILGEEDAEMADSVIYNFWLAEPGKTNGTGFTLKLDACARLIAGCQIKNMADTTSGYSTKNFTISGSHNETGPWETLVEDQLAFTSKEKPASLLSFTFDKPVEIQFIKFDLVSYWGSNGGALQYFAAILATSKKHQFILKW